MVESPFLMFKSCTIPISDRSCPISHGEIPNPPTSADSAAGDCMVALQHCTHGVYYILYIYYIKYNIIIVSPDLMLALPTKYRELSKICTGASMLSGSNRHETATQRKPRISVRARERIFRGRPILLICWRGPNKNKKSSLDDFYIYD